MINTFFKIQILIAFSLTLFLSGCATKVQQVIIAPEANFQQSNIYEQKAARINISDLRRTSHIVQVIKAEQAAQLYSSQQSLFTVVTKYLTAGYKSNGLKISDLASNEINITIEYALVDVQQSLLKYSAKSEIKLKVVINNQQQTLTRNFIINGNNKGPLKADLAVLERDFNQQLAKVLTQIIESKDIQQFLK